MRLSEYRRRLAQAIKEMNDTREREAIDVTADGIELVKLRVINTGEKSEGGKFRPYSRNILPWFFFGSSYGKNGTKLPAFNVPNKVAQLKKLKPAGASYYDWRGVTGRVTQFKNFSFTNDMWASIRALLRGKTRASVTVSIRSSIKFYQDTVIPAHNNREKTNILQLSEKERGMVYQAFAVRRFNILRKHGLVK